jgi:hypothetical protein
MQSSQKVHGICLDMVAEARLPRQCDECFCVGSFLSHQSPKLLVLAQSTQTTCRWLELLLLESERAWALAQELKTGMEKDGFVHTCKRRHMLRRFTKASKTAGALAEAAAATGDARTAAEARVYADLAAALELFEKVRP